jgi:hypothetical protein
MKTHTILRGSQSRSTVMIAATTVVFAGFFILWSQWAYAITPEHVIDEVAPGSLSAWEVTDEEYNPVLTYEEVTSPYDGSTAIETSVVGNTISMCETKSLKRTYAYGGNTSDTDLQAYLAFTSSMSYYNLPYVVVQLLDEADTVIEYQVYYGTDVTGSYYGDIIASNPDSYTKLPSEAGDFVLDLEAMGSNIDFASFSVILANYTCEGENTTTFDHLRMIGGTPPNTPPVANASSFSVVQGATYHGSVSGSDDDGDALTFEALDPPMYGSRQFFPDGTFTYTADADYAGDDSFTFAATDGKASSEPATVSITITE